MLLNEGVPTVNWTQPFSTPKREILGENIILVDELEVVNVVVKLAVLV